MLQRSVSLAGFLERPQADFQIWRFVWIVGKVYQAPSGYVNSSNADTLLPTTCVSQAGSTGQATSITIAPTWSFFMKTSWAAAI